MKFTPKQIQEKLQAAVAFLAAMKLKQQRREAEQSEAEQEQREKSASLFEQNLVIQDHQVRPKGKWRIWLIYGGRGCGKTWTGSRQGIEYLRKHGKNAVLLIVAPTDKAIRRVCLEGKSGLHTLYKHEFTRYNKTELELDHRSGGKVICISAKDPERLEGPGAGMVWIDEVGMIAEESFKNARLACREGEDPKLLLTTTPKNRKFLKAIMKEKTTVTSHATTYDNEFLSKAAQEDFKTTYKGTRVERQELDGQFIEDVEGAFWNSSDIDDNRRTLAQCPEFVTIRMGVDPMTKKKRQNAETGITVAALGTDGHCYIFESSGYRLSPAGWGGKVVDAYYRHTAEAIIAEDNQGGDMVESTIRAAAGNGDGGLSAGELLNIRRIHARVSKSGRAEPVSVLYKRGFVHHVGVFPELEEQMCSFPVSAEYKDRLDSMVYVVADLLLGSPEATLSELVNQEETQNKWGSLTSSSKIDPNMR